MTRKGVWNLQQVRDKYLQSLWVNSTALWAWGGQFDDSRGLLGQNDGDNNTSVSSPVQVGSDDEGWQASGGDASSNYNSAGGNAMYSIKTDGTLWTWGYNFRGVLGLNNQGQKVSSPTQIPGTTWATVGNAGAATVSAIKTDGTLWVWGRNDNGNLGLNQPGAWMDPMRSSPTQIGSATNWTAVAGGEEFFLARKSNGELWSWGYNAQGSLGQNSTNPDNNGISSPVQIPGTTWSNDIVGSGGASFAIKTDGTLWAWGVNNDGQLGVNNKIYYSSPVQVGSGTDWATLHKNSDMTRNVMAVKTDGSLWMSGGNNYGQLGQNSRTEYSSPVQIPGTWSTTIQPVGVNYGRRAMAVKADNTLWAWGHNVYGVLGQNQSGPVSISSPVQVPGNWADVINARYTAFGIKIGLTPSQL
tara:strand:+ start:43 stop:1281 length:1239 start_codon:yes stop_codon:yes gene_type:complete